MRLFSLIIAIAVLAVVGYVSFTTPSQAAVFDSRTTIAAAG